LFLKLRGFLLSSVLVGEGFVIRQRVSESPSFKREAHVPDRCGASGREYELFCHLGPCARLSDAALRERNA